MPLVSEMIMKVDGMGHSSIQPEGVLRRKSATVLVWNGQHPSVPPGSLSTGVSAERMERPSRVHNDRYWGENEIRPGDEQ